MNKLNETIIITIGRSFGSGGREIGRTVAKELGIPLYDKEILEVEAREGLIDIDYLIKYDEKNTSSFLNRFLYSMALNPYSDDVIPLDMLIQEVQLRALEAVASKGSCVIVGRRADKILCHEFNVLSVFISAPLEKRIARVSTRDGLAEQASKEVILKADKARQAYYNAHNGKWGEASNYNLCINSGNLGIENSATLIIEYLKLKGKID